MHSTARKFLPMSRTLFLCLLLAPAQLAAQMAAMTDAPPPIVQVHLEAFTEVPELSETGLPVLDENGAPVMIRLAAAESVITPGDEVIYSITVDNQTDQPATGLLVTALVTEELVLDPFSFAGATDVIITWADQEEPELFRPLFEVIDGADVMVADLDMLRRLRLHLPALKPASQISVEYTVTLR
jgi:uncharacterized repeat protein (TIGR01451 family)